MTRPWLATLLLLLLVLGRPATATAQSAEARVDSMLIRLRALVGLSSFTGARSLADSALGTAGEGTPRYGDVLYWRSLTGRTPDETRRDLVRIAVEYPFSPRFPDALVKLAEIERAAGDRASARRRLERVVRDHLDSSIGAGAALALGEQLMDEGAVVEACPVLDSARAHAGEAQVELANRIAYTSRQCAQRLAATVPPPPAVTVSAAAKGQWSVQVAAHKVRGDALRLEARLKARGYDVRIFGTAPYRVRIGKFATRAEAAAIVAKLNTEGTTAIVVEAERR